MRAALVTLAAVVALALGAGAGAQGTTTLNGTVGPGFTIRLVDGSGNSVHHLDPGSYTIQVVDKSPEHNFHITGPGRGQGDRNRADRRGDRDAHLERHVPGRPLPLPVRRARDHDVRRLRRRLGDSAAHHDDEHAAAAAASATRLAGSVGPGKRIARHARGRQGQGRHAQGGRRPSSSSAISRRPTTSTSPAPA